MAKHRSQWSLHRYHKLMEEGRGQGVLQDYKPWITIHDLASKGVVSRVWGQKTGRIHHFLSRNETAFFFILDASEKVFDIREQFPLLPVSETLEIARQAGIRHPRDTRSLYPYVMTSDFVITTKDGITKVRSVKLSKELSRRATGRTLYVLDEPSVGLHSADVHKLIEVLDELVNHGNSVLVIEHNMDIIKVADYLIDLGPEGGDKGGCLVASGTPEAVAKVEGSYTGQYLRNVLGK